MAGNQADNKSRRGKRRHTSYGLFLRALQRYSGARCRGGGGGATDQTAGLAGGR